MSSLNVSEDPLTRTIEQQQRDAVNDAIDRLQATLEDARSLPSWGVFLVVITSLLCVIILLHAIALVAVGPCVYASWKKRRERVELLLQEEQEVEMAPAPEQGQ